MPPPLQPHFKHEPLDTGLDGTRLLKLLPGSDESPVECEITNVVFPISNTYSALSYEWGENTSECHILLNGVIYYIQPNLHAFLWQLRRQLAAERPMFIWADAICIDQHNVNERNHQVKMMKYIYSETYETLIWLGEEADGSTELLTFLSSFMDEAHFEAHLQHFRLNPKFVDGGFLSTMARTKLGVREDGQTMGVIQISAAVDAIAERSYWKRIWIVQEICLSERSSIFVGPCHTHYGGIHLLGAFWSAARPEPSIKRFRATQCRMVSLGALTEVRYSPERGFDLKMLFSFFKDSQCHLPHDKIYGMLGMAIDCQKLHVDYDMSCLELMARTIVAGTSRVNGLYMRALLYCLGVGPHEEIADFVQDWLDHIPKKVLDKIVTTDIQLYGEVFEARKTKDSLKYLLTIGQEMFEVEWYMQIQKGDQVYFLRDFSLCLVFRRHRGCWKFVAAALVGGHGIEQCSYRISEALEVYISLEDLGFFCKSLITGERRFPQLSIDISHVGTEAEIKVQVGLLMIAVSEERYYADWRYPDKSAVPPADHEKFDAWDGTYRLTQVFPRISEN